jgi:hypothetical protein
MQGWIKLHRCLLTKPIWNDSTPEQKTVLMTILMLANHQGREWEFKGEKYKAEPGQFVTSLESLAQKCGKGVSIQNVRTSLKRFEKYDFLTNESTNKNRLITIVNWALYQSNSDELTNNLTGNQQATNKQLTTNKNDKNDKERYTRKQVYDDTSIFYKLAVYFFERIRENNPDHKEPNFKSWAEDVRKMMEIDKRTEEQIRYLMNWVQQDDFEMTNVLSPSKLRKRFDQLIMKVKLTRTTKPKVIDGPLNSMSIG